MYAIADGDQVVMIDGGWALADSRDRLEASLRSVGYGLGDIREFLVTHIHRDHFTQAIALRRAFGSTVALGEGERVSLEAMRTVEVHPDVATLRTAGAIELSEMMAAWTGEHDLTDWEDPDRWLSDGVDLPLKSRTLRVIATPGHTRGHVVFHDPQAKILFAGDHVLPHITPSIGIELEQVQSPLRDYMASLRIVKALPDAKLLPAHGPVIGSAHARVDALLAHHEHRLVQTADAVASGADTGYAAAVALPWTRHHRQLADLDVFNQSMAIRETMAHLEVLVERGVLTRHFDDGIARFALS